MCTPLAADSKGSAGAPEKEIEITPEMTEAGAKVLAISGLLPWNSPHWERVQLAEDIFRSMMLLAR